MPLTDPVDIYLKEQKVVNFPISNMMLTLTNYQLVKLIKDYPEWKAKYYVEPTNDHNGTLREQGDK